MKITKTKPNEYGWYCVFKYRESMDDLIIERKTKNKEYSENEATIYIDSHMVEPLQKFISEVQNYRLKIKEAK